MTRVAAVIPQPVKRRPIRKRLGMDGYARIYVRLKRGASEEDLRIEGFVSSKFNVKRIVASFYKLGLIRVQEWRVTPGRPVQAVYCHGGSLPDAAPPERTAHPTR